MAWALRVSTPVTTGSLNPIPSGGSTLALGAAVSAGDRIVVGVLTFRTGSGVQPAPTVTDNLNTGSYVEDASVTYIDGGVQVRASLFSMGNSAAGTPTVKLVSGTGSDQGGFSAMAFSGLSTANDGSGLDVKASNHSVFTGSVGAIGSGSTSATTAANELRVGYYADDGWNNTLSAGTGLTQDVVHGSDVTSYEGLLEHQDSGASGSTTGVGIGSTSGINTNTPWAMLCGVYKLAGAGGGTTPSSSDSATVTDTANQIGVNGPADSASQTDTTKIATGSSDAASLAEQNAIALLNSDAAAFAEQVAITVSTATSDSATLTDSASANAGQVNKSDADTAALAEQIKLALTATDSAQLGEAMAIALARTDTATLQELVSVAIAIADAAALTEGATVSAHTSATDTATLSGESGSVTQQGNNPTASDAATLADTASTTAAVSTSDIGALAEQAAIKLGAADVASMTEHIGLGLIAADSAALIEQLQLAVANASTDAASLAELQNAVNAALAAAEAAHVGESATVQVFSGGARDWVYVISAPMAKWSASVPSAKWATSVPSVKWSAGAPQQ